MRLADERTVMVEGSKRDGGVTSDSNFGAHITGNAEYGLSPRLPSRLVLGACQVDGSFAKAVSFLLIALLTCPQ